PHKRALEEGSPIETSLARPVAVSDEANDVPSGDVLTKVRVQTLTEQEQSESVARSARDGSFSRADLLRVAVIFGFGLVHGVGFAGALGIDELFSWSLLGALLVFNVGIEVAQLMVIA